MNSTLARTTPTLASAPGSYADGDPLSDLQRARLSALVQDTLRGPTLASIPFFDQKKVISFLDRVETMDEGSRVANDQLLMTLTSACILHERFGLTA